METKQTAVEWIEDEVAGGKHKIIDANYDFSYYEFHKSCNHAKELERQQLEAAFKAGWMRANATNYDDSYFQHFLSENYDNH